MKNLFTILTLGLMLFTINNVFAISDTNITKESHIWVKNNGITPLTLIVERTENLIPDSSVNYFCWGACYPPEVSISTDMVTILPGAIDKYNFIGDYIINGGDALIDTSQITYCFIDTYYSGNLQCFTALYSLYSPADSLYPMISFDTSWSDVSTDIVKHNTAPSINVFPNPAQDIINLGYSLDSKYIEGYFILRNMFGLEVIKVNLHGTTSKIGIPISDLKRGIYFYSLVIDKKEYLTKKMIISY